MSDSARHLSPGFRFLAGLKGDDTWSAVLDADRIAVTEAYGTEEERALIAFAKSRGIKLVGSDWRLAVYKMAALEYLGIRPKPDRRGRPRKKVGIMGLFSPLSSTEYNARRLIDYVDKKNSAVRLSGAGKLITDRSMVRRVIEAKHNIDPDTDGYDALVNNLANQVSQLRRETGRQRRPRKK